MSSEQESSKWQDIADEQKQEEALVAEDITQELDSAADDDKASEVAEEAANQTAEIGQADYDSLQKQLLQAENLAHENWEKAVRATAETDNVRRRAERDVESAHKYGSEKFITSLLPVIDSLEQALQAANTNKNESNASIIEGIELTLKLFADAFLKAKVEILDPVGEAFDPNRHEAMSMQDAPEAAPGSVIMVFQKGYVLNNRVIRPARVVVAKGKFVKVDKEV